MLTDKMGKDKEFKIGKVTVDMSRFTGNGIYSDGDIENEILEALKNGTADKMLHEDNRWPVLYHLSPVRHHLLDGLDFKENASVLEIGCGCGGISGILCKKAAHVEAVEISPRRAEIAAYRNKDYDNFTIHVGNLNDMKFEKKFDYVTLIGVLEYAGSFTQTDNPYHDFLENCRRFLKDDGVLIIAIENRLGMKYWSGAAEDHTGRLFDGMTGYQGITHVKTFSRAELRKLVNSVGFEQIEWFYPYPDYKMPTDIYSDRRLPTESDILDVSNCPYDMDKAELFSEKLAFINILEAELYPEFANSFLILCHQRKKVRNLQKLAYIHHAECRANNVRLATALKYENGEKQIYKYALNEESKNFLKSIAENCEILNGVYGKDHVAQCEIIDDITLRMEYIEGKTFLELALEALKEEGASGIAGYLEFYCKHILKGTGDNTQCADFDFTAKKRVFDFDLHFDNIIFNGSTFVIIDYEWLLPMLSFKFAFFRTMTHLSWKYRDYFLSYGITLEMLLQTVGISQNDAEKYLQKENDFRNIVQDRYMLNYIKTVKSVRMSY